MIKANELRLGNYILEGGEPSNIYMIDRGGISFYRINDIAVNKESGCTLNGGDDRFKPLTLTPEWLKRCGFVSTLTGDDFHSAIIWDDPKSDYHYCEDGYFIDNRGDYGHYCDIGDVKYVHQLQNLYFALTGEELTINNEHLQTTG